MPLGINALRILFSMLAVLVVVHARAQLNSDDWVVSALLLESAPIDSGGLNAALMKRVSEQDKFTGVEARNDTVLVRIGKGTALVSLTPSPMPGQEVREICQRAWYWRAACDTVNRHKAHLRIVLRGTELKKLDSAVLMTKVVAAVVEQSNAIAVFWGSNLQSSDAFLKGSETVSPRSIPVMLWVNYQLSREASGNVSIFTRGLKEFNLMEIEAKNAPYPGRDLLELMLSTSQYLIAKGPVIEDGDTIGGSPARRIYVKHADSYWNPGKKAYRIEFGG